MVMQMRYPYPVGRYSYGPLASGNHQCVESVGSFCSFAFGSDVVFNHATDYITTHPMIDSISDNSCMNCGCWRGHNQRCSGLCSSCWCTS